MSIFTRTWQMASRNLICPGCFKLCDCMAAEHETEPHAGMITICICGVKLKIEGEGTKMRYVKATREDIRKLDKVNRRRLDQYEEALKMSYRRK